MAQEIELLTRHWLPVRLTWIAQEEQIEQLEQPIAPATDK